MCFVKSPSVPVVDMEADVSQRPQADSSVTKTKNNEVSAFKQNLKTAPLGLENTAQVQKKTLLGE